jgi:hypothetical protein
LRYQFLLGPDLMVAPVLDKGADAVEVYFPRGAEWIDLWTRVDAGKPGHWGQNAGSTFEACCLRPQGISLKCCH